MKRAAQRRARAFTLVELLVVLGIIAVLVAILVPTVSRAREKAKQVQCLSNLRNLAHAFLGYANENEGYLPGPALPSGGQSDDWIYWEPGRDLTKSAVARYLGDPVQPSAFRCPSDDINSHGKMQGNSGLYLYSYAMNSALITKSYHGMALSKVISPAAKVLVFDESGETADDGYGDLLHLDLVSVRHDPLAQLPDSTSNWNTSNKHRNGNVAFCDGHADFVDRNDIQQNARAYDPTIY